MSNLLRSLLFLVAVPLVGCMQQTPAPAPDTRAADEAAVRAAIGDWLKAGQAKDADGFASFYADDGRLMLGAAPDSVGRPAIRETIGTLMSDPNFALSFATANVVVARSGDLAYETGSYELHVSDPNQQPITEKGNYVVVWRKQADGAWKVAVDAPSSDP